MIVWSEIKNDTNIFNNGGNECSPFLSDVLTYDTHTNKVVINEFHHYSRLSGGFLKPATHFSILNKPKPTK